MVANNPIQERKRLWLREALRFAGGTITEVAGRIAWDRSELSAMLNGHRAITDRKAQALSEALNYPLPDMGIGYKPQDDDTEQRKAIEPRAHQGHHQPDIAELMMMMLRLREALDDLRKRLDDLERRGFQEKM